MSLAISWDRPQNGFSMPTQHARVEIDLARIYANAEQIRRETGVEIKPVIKADAYGLGAERVASALAPLAQEFCYFSLNEAHAVGRPGLILGPPFGDAEEYKKVGVRPTVSNFEQRERFRQVPSSLEIDTGMQRFGCDLFEIDKLLRDSAVQDIWTHACSLSAVERFLAATRGIDLPKHAACSSLLHEPRARLHAVRPGIALYRGAVQVSTRLAVARDTYGPAGYRGFHSNRVGVILIGYSHGLRAARVRINDRPQQMLEVGMNTAFVSLDPADKVGDEVTLLGNGITEQQVAEDIGGREHEVLCRYCRLGERIYRE
ncbi:MAG: alanine racemase [Phycisphaerae bacterium]|nr:alanine racemase [Phycisphaerae bacterium]